MFKNLDEVYNNHYAIENKPMANTDFIKRKYLDIKYANGSSSQKLDIYLPEKKQKRYPVLLILHGGAFLGGDKANVEILPMLKALKRSYAVISANYRFSWQAKFPALIYDIKAAVRWIKANAKKYKLDSKKIGLWGASAGAYIASFMAVSAGYDFMEDLSMGNPNQSSNVNCVTVWYTPTNFLKMDKQLEENDLLAPKDKRHNNIDSPESLLMGNKITAIPELIRMANPENYITNDTPPMLLQHGKKDATVPVQQSINFADKLKKKIGKKNIELDVLSEAGHADEIFQEDNNVQRVLDFFDKVLR